MYNEEQKKSFIRSFTEDIDSRKFAQKLFEAFAPYEEGWGADLCTKDEDTLRPVVSKLAGLRNVGRYKVVFCLQHYVDWCLEHKIPGAQDGISGIRTLDAGNMSTQMVNTPGMLQQYLNAICDPEEEQTTDSTLRVFCWLAFAGMQVDDILLVRTKDVDFKRAQVHFNGVDYPIYREAFPAFRNCVELKQFVYNHPNYTAVRDRVDGDLLVRGVRSVPTKDHIRTEVSRRTKAALKAGKTTRDLSYRRIWLSGVFYRMWEREQQGMPVDFEAQAKLLRGDRIYQLGSGRNKQEAVCRKIQKNYVIDYQRWKQTFR